MQSVHKAMAVVMMATVFCAAAAEAAPQQPAIATHSSPLAGPMSDPALTALPAPADPHAGPSADAVEAIPTPSAMNLGGVGLAIFAATRIARRLRLAA